MHAGQLSRVVGHRRNHRCAPRRQIVVVLAMRMEPQYGDIDGRGIEAAAGELVFRN